MEKEILGVKKGRTGPKKGKIRDQKTPNMTLCCFFESMIKRDNRYNLIKLLHANGEIQILNDIFNYVPKTVVATDLGKKVTDFNVLLARPDNFELREIYRIGSLCGLSDQDAYLLVEAQYLRLKKPNRNSDP